MSSVPDPSRESNPQTLPQLQVFCTGRRPDSLWYWQSPGTDPVGPFATEAGALADAQDTEMKWVMRSELIEPKTGKVDWNLLLLGRSTTITDLVMNPTDADFKKPGAIFAVRWPVNPEATGRKMIFTMLVQPLQELG